MSNRIHQNVNITEVAKMETTKNVHSTRVKMAAGIALVMLVLSLAFWFFVSHSKDNIIINMGIRAFARLTTLAKFGTGVSSLALIGVGAKVFVTHINDRKVIEHNEEQKRIDPYYEEGEIINKLKSVKYKVKPNYQQYADRMLTQLETTKDLQSQYAEIIDNNDMPIIQDIGDKLSEIRLHALHDAKSIYRRLVISEDADVIEKKLNKNDKLISDANDLMVQAISYLDTKTESNDIDLKNLIKAFQNLLEQM